MKIANNQVQAKNMSTIAKDTKRTTEIGTKDTTAALVKEVEAVETTRKAADLFNKTSCAGNQTKEVKEKPTNPNSTLKEMQEAQRETTNRIMNYKTNTKKKQLETGTRIRPNIKPPPRSPAQHAGGKQTQPITLRKGKTPIGQRNALGYGLAIPKESNQTKREDQKKI